MPTAKKMVLALLKRLDTVVAAVLDGFCVAPVAQAWLCADMSCRSKFDTVVYFAVAVLGTLGTGLLLWRYTRRWWARVPVVPAALCAVIVVPRLSGRTADGRCCPLPEDPAASARA